MPSSRLRWRAARLFRLPGPADVMVVVVEGVGSAGGVDDELVAEDVGEDGFQQHFFGGAIGD